jgi:hypothetical protein
MRSAAAAAARRPSAGRRNDLQSHLPLAPNAFLTEIKLIEHPPLRISMANTLPVVTN